ncbi:MAG: hypothetical protein K6G01_07595 [Eubacterium sp.]|nr:hypothetical protein [Eubacterium sp.]
MTAELICVGTTYVMGMLEEPVQSYLAGRLTELGVEIHQRRIITEERNTMTKIINEAFQDVELVVVTGERLWTQEEVKNTIDGFDDMDTDCGRREEDNILVPSPSGGTQGFILKNKEDQVIVVLPGVAKEVEMMFEYDVVGYLLRELAEGKVSVFMKAFMKGDTDTGLVKRELNLALEPALNSVNPSVYLNVHDDYADVRVDCVGPTKTDAILLAQMMIGDMKSRTKDLVEWKIEKTEEEG